MHILFLGYDRHETRLIEFLEADGHTVSWQGPKEEIDDVLLEKADMIISYGYCKIIRPYHLKVVNGKAINLHIGYLPWNRGMYPNFWSIVDSTPSGVTIHMIDEGLDTGRIIAQVSLPLYDRDTLKTSYMRLRSAIEALFMEEWFYIIENDYTCPKRLEQNPRRGSEHTKKEGEAKFYLLGDEGWDCKVSDLKKRVYKEKRENNDSG